MQVKQEQRHRSGEPGAGPDDGQERAGSLETGLRLLIGRLCLAGLGRHPALDEQLKRISQLARAGFDAAQIAALLEPLSHAVALLDELAADGGAAGTADAGEATGIRDQRNQLQREKAEVEELLRQLDARLETIAAFFALEEQQHSDIRDDTQRLNESVMDEVKEISADMGAASSLAELRGRVGSRLNAISRHIDDYRAREDRRHADQTNRTRALRTRVEELERESRALQRSLREEQRLALLDALTGIANRAAWNERISREFERWQHDAGVVCLLVWDVDHFKDINDEYGHKAGDRMLRVLAQHLAREMRPGDFVARYGGEEFVMLMAGRSMEEALQAANEIRAGVRDIAFHFRTVPVAVTLSCGITAFRTGDTPDTAFDRADRALYAAKDAGRNRCVMR